jgi:hypothetical protein
MRYNGGVAFRVVSPILHQTVSKYEKLMARLLGGDSDANFFFRDLCYILFCTGFEERVSGSHHMFSRPGVEELVNLQTYQDSRKAKPYQVRQVRNLLVKYGLGGGRADDQV